MCRSIIEDRKILVELGLAIDDTGLEVKVRSRGVSNVGSSYIDVVAVPSDVINKAIQGSHIVSEYASILLRVSAFSPLCQKHKLLQNRHGLCQYMPVICI